MTEEIPLFRKYPKLRNIPWVSTINSPTPIHKMEEISKELNHKEIWVKRDDLTDDIYGGNKLRKYEFVFADILKKNKKRILTQGAIGTNHGLATTVHAKKFGLETHLFLVEQKLSQHVRENLLCHHYFGARLNLMKSNFRRKLAIKARLFIDKKAYFVTTGASSPLGTLGFVNAAFELKEQIDAKLIPEPDKLFVTVGSLATCAGLVLGLELAKVRTKVIGIGVTDPIWSSKKNTLDLAVKALELMRTRDSSIPDVSDVIGERLIVDHRYFGGQYGVPTEEAMEAIKIAKKDELKLEYVYTGKTLSGLIDYIRKNKLQKDEIIIFWNSKSSADLTSVIEEVNYQDLPRKFHKFFDGSVKMM
ncbi:MAG: pyridoxal-phosphate dependent enzyme [Candidatus Heimdallarchaeota archaeon]|nr:pyridoxal-phosphate dependent enzyme [Candidatus Heimdallarchaeota archaeon]